MIRKLAAAALAVVGTLALLSGPASAAPEKCDMQWSFGRCGDPWIAP